MSGVAEINENLEDPEVNDDPYGYYGWLRENDPVHWNPVFKLWVVSRYEDVVAVFRKSDVFSSALPFMENPEAAYPPIDKADWPLAELVQEFKPLVYLDRPQHTVLRQAVHRWFTPRAIERWRSELARTAQEIIDRFRGDGEVELMSAFANAFPLTTIRLLLGIPAEDAPHLNTLTVGQVVDPGAGPGRLAHAYKSAVEFREYFDPLLEARGREPREDLVSVLSAAECSGTVTREQSLASLMFLFEAGHETTLGLISKGVLAFIRHPDEWVRFRADPEELAGSATEECLRYDPPIKFGPARVIKGEIEMRGVTLREGEKVGYAIASANRDPREFPDPDRFDITRVPNRHVAFGGGIHHCLGASLARVQGQEAFKALARNFERLRLVSEPEWDRLVTLHRVTELHVSWGA
jgi:cytochrome P450